MNSGFTSIRPARASRAAGAPESARRWAVPLAVAVLSYGVAAGLWKQAELDAAKFSVVYVLGKTLVCWGAWWLLGKRPLVTLGSGPFWRVSLLAGALNGLAWIAYFIAFARGPLGLVQSITATYAVLAALLAAVFLGERLSRAQGLGVFIVMIGGVLMSSFGEGEASGEGGRGWIPASLVAIGLWGANAVLVKRAYGLPGADDYRMWLAHWAGVAITMLPFALGSVSVGHLGGETSLAAILVVFLYLFGDLAFYVASARGPVSVVNALGSLYPIPAIVYSACVLGDVPDRTSWIIIGSSLAGVVLIAARSKKQAPMVLSDRQPSAG